MLRPSDTLREVTLVNVSSLSFQNFKAKLLRNQDIKMPLGQEGVAQMVSTPTYNPRVVGSSHQRSNSSNKGDQRGIKGEGNLKKNVTYHDKPNNIT